MLAHVSTCRGGFKGGCYGYQVFVRRFACDVLPDMTPHYYLFTSVIDTMMFIYSKQLLSNYCIVIVTDYDPTPHSLPHPLPPQVHTYDHTPNLQLSTRHTITILRFTEGLNISIKGKKGAC